MSKSINFRFKNHKAFYQCDGRFLYHNTVRYYTPVYTTDPPVPLTDKNINFKSKPMDTEQSLPGISLAQWLEATETSYSAFARMIPCSVSYPRKVALGLSWPSYDMATRIETLTEGLVPRTRWYPPGPTVETNTEDNLIQ